MAYNESHVCDVAPSPTRARGHVAERRAAAPHSPRRLLRRRSTYVLLCVVPAPGISLKAKYTRVAVDGGFSVGNCLLNTRTRANQEEPRSSIARLSADEHSRRGERYSRWRRRTPSCCNERAARLTKTITRGGGHKPFCGKGRYRQRYAYESERAKELNRTPESR